MFFKKFQGRVSHASDCDHPGSAIFYLLTIRCSSDQFLMQALQCSLLLLELAFELLDFVKSLLSRTLKVFFLLLLVSLCPLLQLMVRAFPVLRSHSNFLIKFHDMRHLILKSKQFFFKILDCFKQVVFFKLAL